MSAPLIPVSREGSVVFCDFLAGFRIAEHRRQTPNGGKLMFHKIFLIMKSGKDLQTSL